MTRTRIGTIILAVLALSAVILIVVGLSAAPIRTDTVTGQVVSVESISETDFSRLSIVDDSGKQWTFQSVNTFPEFAPAHLEEHSKMQEPVTVDYETTITGFLKIQNISD